MPGLGGIGTMTETIPTVWEMGICTGEMAGRRMIAAGDMGTSAFLQATRIERAETTSAVPVM